MKVTPHVLKFGLLIITSLAASGPLSLRAQPWVAAGYSVQERGPHHRLLGRVAQNPDGTTVTNGYYEIANGMHYYQNGEWIESQDLIELAEDGSAIAVQGPVKARFNANLTRGAILYSTPQERAFRTRPIGLFLFDAASGKTIRLETVDESATAEFYPPNQVIYKRIFGGPESGAIQADLRLTYTKGMIESDLILLEKPGVTPEMVGLSPETTRLEFWHVWEGAGTPQQRPIVLKRTESEELRKTMVEPDFIDSFLDFGEIQFPGGRAYSMKATESRPFDIPAEVNPLPRPGENTIRVGKQWHEFEEFSILIEGTCWSDIKGELSSLPSSAVKPAVDVGVNRASFFNELTLGDGGTKPARPIALAAAPYAVDGFVLDYLTVYSKPQETFYGPNEHPFINGFSGTYQLMGHVVIQYVTLRSGTVLKHSGTTPYLMVTSNLTCQASASNPSVITVLSDDVVGESLPGSTHNPQSGSATAGLYWYGDHPSYPRITNVTVRFATYGILFAPSGYAFFAGCSLQFCSYGCYLEPYYGGYGSVTGSSYCSVAYPLYPQQNFSGTLSNICSGDADGDSLPDLWEYRHFGHTDLGWNANPDLDGFNNWNEYLYETDPCTWPSFTNDRIEPIGGRIIQPGESASFSFTCNPASAYKRWFVGGTDQGASQSGTEFTLSNISTNYDGYPVGARLYNALGTNTWGEPYRVASLAVLLPASWGRWTNFLTLTNGHTVGELTTIWQTYSYSPPNPPTLAWNPNSLIYGKTGWTAISQYNSWGTNLGEIAVTALTRRHGYMRGHGNTPGHKVGKTVWFCTTSNQVVGATIAAAIGHNDDDRIKEFATTTATNTWSDTSGQDYCLVIFTNDLPDGVVPMAVCTNRGYGKPLHFYVRTCLGGTINCNVPPFDVGGPMVPGNSGSPDMLLTTNNELVFFEGRTTDGPSDAEDFMKDLNDLTLALGLTTNNPNYQLTWRSEVP